MIYGIGSDIVNIKRIERLLTEYGDRFINRILSPHEIEQFNAKNSPSYLAKRFAGKEAFSKAIGTGIGKPLRFNDITIFNDSLGKPEIRIEDPSKMQILKQYKNIHISLSDDYPMAIAFVLIS